MSLTNNQYPDRSKGKDITPYVEYRLNELYSIKSERLTKHNEYKELYKGKRVNPKSPTKSDYKTNAVFSIINTKASEILAATPTYEFVPLDDLAKTNRPIREMFWKYIWMITKSDKELYKVVMDALKYGSGFWYEGLLRDERTHKIPYEQKDGTIEYKEKKVMRYDGVFCEYIPYDKVYLDGNDIEESNELVIIKDWDRDDFIRTYENNPNYSNVNENLPKGKTYYVGDGGITTRASDLKNEEDIVTELRYWNKSKDEYIVLVNSIWVNPISGNKVSPLPFEHKELPISIFTDHYLEDSLYGMGEYEITEEDIALKDALRSISLDATKYGFGLMTIDPTADIDEATLAMGPGQFARLQKDDISFFAPNVNTQAVVNLENKIDDDLIIKTGIDYRSQLLSPSETAAKTEAKLQSTRKRINLNLKYNAYTFFERLARLRMANMEQFYHDKTMKIPVDGISVGSKGEVEPVNGGYGLFTMRPEFLAGKFAMMPVTESLFGENLTKQKREQLEFTQIVGNILGKDGQPIVSGEKIIEDLAPIFNKDVNKLLASSEQSKKPEDILAEVEGGPTPGSPEEMMGEGFVPPAQRSGANVGVPTISGSANE